MTTLRSQKPIPTSGGLKGRLRVPGDKSISHRALIMGALAVGETTIAGLLEGEDVLGTAACLQALGADIYKDDQDCWHVHGVGIGGLRPPENVLDMGNSGTGARLMMGLLATHPLTATFSGDASLSKRPMGRVVTPLTLFGAHFHGRDGNMLPITVTGATMPLPVSYELPVASAQVKSAIMLAALNTPGVTTVIENTPTRDHTERMFEYFGVSLDLQPLEGGTGRRIKVTGQPELVARDLKVPTDPSSAAFAIVAALITPDSELTIEHVGLNPARIGLFTTLQDMGADITYANKREECGEPVADIVVRTSALKGVTVPPERAPSMIDEYPVLCVAAAAATGQTVMRGLEELRVKESDRIAVMVTGLKACGVQVEEHEDGMTVSGNPDRPVIGGACVETHLDHRIAMSFLMLGLISDAPIDVDDGSVINTSFPNFVTLMNGLGTNISIM